MAGHTTYRDAAAAAHELAFRLHDDTVILGRDAGPEVSYEDMCHYVVEPRFVGARGRLVNETTGDGRRVLALIRWPRPGAKGGIESIFTKDNAWTPCDWCEGTGYIVTLGGYRPCGRCGGTGDHA
jgi:hypothetical protein